MDYYTALVGSVGILLAVLIPGLAISFAIYPKKDELDLVERFGYSLFLGFMPYVLLYFLQKNFSVPATTQTAYGVAIALTIISLLVYSVRKNKREER
ncbi:MAG: hypothetical protein ABH950_09880 [Candidatus Altiarchaeota archaeon]